MKCTVKRRSKAAVLTLIESIIRGDGKFTHQLVLFVSYTTPVLRVESGVYAMCRGLVPLYRDVSSRT